MQRSLLHLLHGLVLAGAFLLGWVQEVRADGAGAPPMELAWEHDAEGAGSTCPAVLPAGDDDASATCRCRSHQLTRSLRLARACQRSDHAEGRWSGRHLLLFCGGFTSAP